MSTRQVNDRGEVIPGRAVPSGSELRRAARTLTSQKAVVYPYHDPAGATTIPGWACDVSAIGVGLILEKPLPSGREFLLHMGPRPGPAGKMLYTVVHCHVCGERYHRVGAELVAVLLDPGTGAGAPAGELRQGREGREPRNVRQLRPMGPAPSAAPALAAPSPEMVQRIQRIRYAVLG